jgi:hypothetical protein
MVIEFSHEDTVVDVSHRAAVVDVSHGRRGDGWLRVPGRRLLPPVTCWDLEQ